MFTEDKETLCSMHSTVMFYLREMRKDLKKKKKELPNLDISFELEKITELLALIRKAKSSGQHMENALVRYRRAFESCNYRRVHKGVIQPKI